MEDEEEEGSSGDIGHRQGFGHDAHLDRCESTSLVFVGWAPEDARGVQRLVVRRGCDPKSL